MIQLLLNFYSGNNYGIIYYEKMAKRPKKRREVSKWR